MAETATNAPTASKHIFMHQICEQKLNSKVRFLGCVLEYEEKTGELVLQHRHSRDRQVSAEVIVDVNMVLETVLRSLLQSGTWINVIGYVRTIPVDKRRRPDSRSDRLKEANANTAEVQAVLLWGAGAIRLDTYEQILEDQIAANAGK